MYFYNTDRQSEIPDEENATDSNAMQKSTYTSLMIQNVIELNKVYGSIQYPVLNNFAWITFKTNL